MAEIADYLDPERVIFLDVPTRDAALKEMTSLLEGKHLVDNVQDFHQALIEREKIVSTGIGMGIAVPHAKLPACQNFFIVIGILKDGVDWQAIDGSPVRLIFMIGGPDDKQTEYLQILSSLTLTMKDEDRRKKMLRMTDPQIIVNLFKTF